MRKRDVERLLERIAEKYGYNFYIQKNNGYYSRRWNIVSCQMGTFILGADTLQELFYNIIMYIAEYHGNGEFCERDLLTFAKKEELI